MSVPALGGHCLLFGRNRRVTGSQSIWPWKLLLAAILIVMAAGTWGAVNRIDYTWRWNRVPDYFLYKSEESRKIPFDGWVEKIISVGSTSTVSLVSESGEKVTVKA